MEEIIVNFWVYVDLGTSTSYNWAAKPYCLAGSDDVKLNFLETMAETDYKTVERRKFHNAEHLPSTFFNDYFDANADWFCVEVEQSLPTLIAFDPEGKNSKTVRQELSQSPLYVLTHLIENEFGEIRPCTTPENKEWIEREKVRIGLSLL